MIKATSQNRASAAQCGFLVPRLLVSCALFSSAALLTVFGVAATPPGNTNALGQGKTRSSSATNVGVKTGQSSPGLVVSPTSQVWFEGADSLFSKVVAVNSTARARSALPKGQSTFAAEAQPSTRETSPAQESWLIVDTPQAKGALTENFLGAATCVSQSDCWVVGYSVAKLFGGLDATLIEHWDGSSWRIVDSPNTDSALTNNLFGVACNSTSDCWAVGGSLTPSKDSVETLIEHWDGTAWTIVPSPNPSGGIFNVLDSVTCTSDRKSVV